MPFVTPSRIVAQQFRSTGGLLVAILKLDLVTLFHSLSLTKQVNCLPHLHLMEPRDFPVLLDPQVSHLDTSITVPLASFHILSSLNLVSFVLTCGPN